MEVIWLKMETVLPLGVRWRPEPACSLLIAPEASLTRKHRELQISSGKEILRDSLELSVFEKFLGKGSWE